MEIISFFDLKEYATADFPVTHVNDILKQQRPNKLQHKSDILKINETIDVFFTQIKIMLLVLCIVTLCLLGYFEISRLWKNRVEPLVFNTSTENIDMAMRKFLDSREVDDFDANGNLSLSELESSVVQLIQPVTYQTYTVQSGDTISSISKKFGLTNISTLIGVNAIGNARLLRPKQQLTIPSLDGLFHIIKSGESLASISQHYDITLENIIDANDLTTDSLVVGQKLFIPGAHLDSQSLKKALGELFSAPLSVKWRVSSPFGYRADPFTGARSFHTGIDLVVPAGTPVKSALGGRVGAVGYSNVYGNYVIIKHSNGYQTLYAHLKYTAKVKSGQVISQGVTVGYVGNTGYSTGAHLHFSVYKNGKLVNPRTILKF